MAIVVSLAMCGVVQAEDVTNVMIRQVKPWQGMVEVGYELETDLSAKPNLSTSVVFTDRTTGKSYTAKTFTHPFTYTKGKKKMIWNAAKDGISFKSSDVVCTVTVTSDGGGSEELYCIIDLSGGTSAASYPVTYLSSVPIGGWTDEYKTTKLVLRRLDAGTFTMGSPSDELGRDSDETQHQVTLTKGFYIGVFVVTQRQWELVMGTRPSWFNNSTYYASRPVERVSYDMIRGSSSGSQWPASNAVDADSFLGKIRAKTGLVFDLPTEAQWEYACRAGTTTALNSGKNLTDEEQDAEMDKVGRYLFNGGFGYSSQSCDPSAGTAWVGSYAPNAWGLYDMHGNVHEWCLDWWQSDLGTSAVTDPVGAASGSDRSFRGGCWDYVAQNCRSASRYYCYPSGGSSAIGFRLAFSVGSLSASAALDLSTGTVTYLLSEAQAIDIEYGSLYGDAEDGTAQFRVNGEVKGSGGTAATTSWLPTEAGTYTLEHRMDKNGTALGTTLTVTHIVNKPVGVVSAVAHQRYPWNGLVDIDVTFDGEASDLAQVECSFVATNVSTMTSLCISHVTRAGGDTGSGRAWKRRYVWNAPSDVGEGEISNVVITVSAKPIGGVQLWENGPYWAECNVGATKPEEYGYYFWWGDTVGYKRNAANDGWVSVKDGTAFSFTEDNCPTYDKDDSELSLAGYIDSTGNLVSAHDAATAHLGAPWRMPTKAEILALVGNCDMQWTTRGGVYGCVVTGRGVYASKSIFLTAAGYGEDSSRGDADSYGRYWSSTMLLGLDWSSSSYGIFFQSGYITSGYYYRYRGLPVRPVRVFEN